jgi:L-ascorbate metabolism protein UlaG (beta-lactamase superfamily)
MTPSPAPTRGPIFPAHFDGTRFYNPGARQLSGLLGVLRWKLTSRPERSPRFLADVVPTVPPPRVDEALRITMVNHSTVLVQQHGLNLLTDPIWSERTSPVSWAGPRRKRAPGIAWDDLPPIDIVLISHNHYDHLDLPTLRRLAARGDSTYVVPAGVARLFRAEKLAPVVELDWGESAEVKGCTIHCVPARHFSSRSPFDRNKALWCGYMIESRGRLVYFAGDTGFGPHFQQIRERFAPPHAALLPIGAYEPRWFMSPVHMSPDEALRAHEILEARTSIAIHHGTFQLADEGLDAAPERLRECGADASFVVLNNGQFAEIP